MLIPISQFIPPPPFCKFKYLHVICVGVIFMLVNIEMTFSFISSLDCSLNENTRVFTLSTVKKKCHSGCFCAGQLQYRCLRISPDWAA